MLLDLNLEYWHWLLIGIVCLTVEMVAPGFSFLWFGVAALCTSGITYIAVEVSLMVQILLFVGLSALFLVVARFLPQNLDHPHEPYLNQRAESMIGLEFKAPHDLSAGVHPIMLQGSLWQVRTPTCLAGAPLKIQSSEDMILIATEHTKANA